MLWLRSRLSYHRNSFKVKVKVNVNHWHSVEPLTERGTVTSQSLRWENSVIHFNNVHQIRDSFFTFPLFFTAIMNHPQYKWPRLSRLCDMLQTQQTRNWPNTTHKWHATNTWGMFISSVSLFTFLSSITKYVRRPFRLGDDLDYQSYILGCITSVTWECTSACLSGWVTQENPSKKSICRTTKSTHSNGSQAREWRHDARLRPDIMTLNSL